MTFLKFFFSQNLLDIFLKIPHFSKAVYYLISKYLSNINGIKNKIFRIGEKSLENFGEECWKNWWKYCVDFHENVKTIR